MQRYGRKINKLVGEKCPTTLRSLLLMNLFWESFLSSTRKSMSAATTVYPCPWTTSCRTGLLIENCWDEFTRWHPHPLNSHAELHCTVRIFQFNQNFPIQKGGYLDYVLHFERSTFSQCHDVWVNCGLYVTHLGCGQRICENQSKVFWFQTWSEWCRGRFEWSHRKLSFQISSWDMVIKDKWGIKWGEYLDQVLDDAQ